MTAEEFYEYKLRIKEKTQNMSPRDIMDFAEAYAEQKFKERVEAINTKVLAQDYASSLSGQIQYKGAFDYFKEQLLK